MFNTHSMEMSYRTVSEINTSMVNVYKHMSIAVLVSMIVSYFVGTTPELLKFFFTGITKWIVIFSPLLAIIGISIALRKNISKSTAQGMLYGFAALMGLSFATIFAVYQISSIASAFMGAAILFGTLSLYGYFTKNNLDSIGKFMFVGLIAIIIASIVNIFIGSSIFAMVISAIGIIVFLGLTAYDTQKIREMVSIDGDTGVQEVSGAITLYLDFINIFILTLQLFGGKKE